jgi:nucleosome binding factor SPN SPT16 subunit
MKTPNFDEYFEIVKLIEREPNAIKKFDLFKTLPDRHKVLSEVDSLCRTIEYLQVHLSQVDKLREWMARCPLNFLGRPTG